MLNLGTEEGFTVKEGRFASVWPRSKELFVALRKQGTPIGVAIDPLTGHQCGNQRYLAIPWFDACLSMRIPTSVEGTMKKVATESHWFAGLPEADLSAEPEALSAEKYPGDPLSAVWLPNESVAKAWMQYVRGEEVTDTTPPPAPTDLHIVDERLFWKPKADLQSGIAYFVVRKDGKQVAKVPAQPTNPFGRPLAQGLLYSDTPDLPLKESQFDVPVDSAKQHEYTVTTVNTVGLESEPSETLSLGPRKQ